MRYLKSVYSMLVFGLAFALALSPVTLLAQEGEGNEYRVIVTDPADCPDPKRFTLNQDIYGIDNMIIRYILEIATSVSSEVQTILPPDRLRIDSYLAALDTYRGWMVGATPSDYPATYKLYYCLTTMPPGVYIASAPLRDLTNQLIVMEGELTLSQSSRMSSGLLPQDDVRFQSYLQRARDYLTNYVDVAAPNDHPRTTELSRLIEGTEPR